MALDPDKVDENLTILLTAIEAYNAEQQYDEYRIHHGSGDPDWSSRLRNHELYPADYQRFVERIGWLWWSPGYMGLNVFSEPLRLGDLQKDDDRTFLGSELMLDRDGLSIAAWAENEGIANHELVAEDPCSYAYVAVDKSTHPYTLVELIEEKQCDSFLEFVTDQLDHAFHKTSLPLWSL